MKALYSIVGMRFRNAVDFVRTQAPGTPVEVRREATNPHDENAVQVWIGDQHIGYVKKEQAVGLAKLLDSKPEAGAHATGRLVFVDRLPSVELDE
jgi:hypothetical protein